MKLRIAMISEHASPMARPGGVDTGGQNVYVAQLARHLVQAGHVVDVFTRRDSDFVAEVLHSPDGYRVINVPAGPRQSIPKEELLPYMEPFADYMLSRMNRQTYDVVHANFFMSGLVGMRLKQRLAVPLAITFHALGRVRLLHQGSADRFPTERLLIEDQLIEAADCIIAECPQDADDQVALYGADRDKLRIIPCGFDHSELYPIDKRKARTELGLDLNTPVILQLGRMVPRKGVDNVVRGFARLVREYKLPGQLVIAGGESRRPDPRKTPEIGRLQGIAHAEGVADRVLFAGRAERSRLKYFYSAADVFVTTPWYEPFGITPLESMACGTPVIGSSVGGIKYSVRDQSTGFLVPPADPNALAARLALLIRNPELAAFFGQQGLKRVKRMFSWRRVTAAVQKVYEEIAVKQPRALRTSVPHAASENREAILASSQKRNA